jgi:hypothetical protein
MFEIEHSSGRSRASFPAPMGGVRQRALQQM